MRTTRTPFTESSDRSTASGRPRGHVLYCGKWTAPSTPSLLVYACLPLLTAGLPNELTVGTPAPVVMNACAPDKWNPNKSAA